MIGLVALLLAAGGFVLGRVLFRVDPAVVQPISFNHRKHAELLECGDCHQFYNERAHSGLPALSLCMDCHEEPQTESAEEEKIRELAAGGREDVFRKLFRLPDHVYYSHQRHVKIANLSCETCHGAIADSETPPHVPLIRMTMDFCMDCHEQQSVPNDCTRCHS